ncbi:hypothetical protein [Haloarcula nitratireducens]|uniref:Uncharacterized protein n=1 Tax=Haloarcula nitratireducens TaxID=2487749 RepID=A0AAW4PGG8_9EURY|nr:hypothetical protein [Halomicroarcula nitratireducens]MBX0296993.1 hypothetical protein [Halomicroarcula nitratireducens]
MKDEQFEQRFLTDRILPLLFNRKSATIFRSARNALESHDTSVSELQEQYTSTYREDNEFWEDVADILSDAYDVTFSDFSDVGFEEFVTELINARFDKEFRLSDIRKLDDETDIDEFLLDIDMGENIVLNSESCNPRIIYVGEKNSREYIEPLQPTEEEYYPPLLLEVNKDDDEIRLSGNKSQRNRFVHTAHDLDTIVLQDEEPEAYDKLDIDPHFIQQLKSHDFFLRDISISGGSSDISLSVSSGEGVIAVQEFVDYDLLIRNKLDLLAVNKCKFVYVTEENDIEFELNFQTFSRTSDNREFIKISLEVSESDPSIRDTIEDVLSRYGIDVYEPYHKPASYYFNKMLTTNRNHRKKYLKSLQEMDVGASVDEILNDGIIDMSSDESYIPLDKEALIKKTHSVLSESAGVDIEANGRQHRIADVEDPDENRIHLVLKSYSDNADDDHRRFYRVIIPFRARPDKFEKIYNVVLSQINYHKILTSESEEEVVKYIVGETRKIIRYHQEMLIEKEARRSAKILEEYYPEPEEFRESQDTKQKAGYEIEDHLNVVLRYLFRDYLSGGGKNEPDGTLQLEGDSYLVDSKQSEKVEKIQLTKSKEDLEESENSTYSGSKHMIFIISKELLLSNTKSGSLNWKARQRVEKGTEFSFHFISVEIVCALYDLFSEHTNIISSSSELQNEIFFTIQSMIDESQFAEDCEDLSSSENKHIGKIRRAVDNVDYMPEDRHRYF